MGTNEVVGQLPDGRVVLRAAVTQVPQIVRLLADDPLGAGRELEPDDPVYVKAFASIDSDPSHLLAVVLDEGLVVGTLQLTLVPGLSRGGALRAQIESVRVAASERGSGLGTSLFEWAIGYSKSRGATLVQLTTDKTRPEARVFYERLGFVASHDGMKLALSR